MDRQMASEEKLLRLIRKKEDDSKKKAKKNKDAGSSKKKGDFLETLNRILILIVMALMGIFAVRFVLSPEADYQPPRVKMKKANSQAILKELELPKPKPFSFYERKIAGSEVFVSPWEKEKPKPKEEKIPQPTVDLKRSYKLLGIVLDDNPQAIIEDKKTKETMFINVGDTMEGVTLDSVFEDRVVFAVGKTKVELTYE